MTQQMDSKQIPENLEALMSKISFEIVNEKILEETEINKLLGVLSSNGVYAMWVWAMDKLGVKFSENYENLKEKRLFKLLNKIAELDKFISKTLYFEKLLGEICNLTKETNQLREEIGKLNQEVKELKIEKEKNKEEIKNKETEKKRKKKRRKEKKKKGTKS